MNSKIKMAMSIVKYPALVLFLLGVLFVPKWYPEVTKNGLVYYTFVICAIILFLYFLFIDYKGRANNTEPLSETREKSWNRTFLTVWMVTAGLAIIVVFGFFVLKAGNTTYVDDDDEAAQWVFNAAVPLIASWIGTVLAFYFGRENFESATDRILQLNKETLDDIPVEQMMISRPTMLFLIKKSDGSMNHLGQEGNPLNTINEVITFFDKTGKDRIPILSEDFKPLYIIHMATLKNAGVDGTKNLDNFLKGQEDGPKLYGPNMKKGFVTVKPSTKLENAEKIRTSQESCRDVFITDDGTPDSPVAGWVTDTLATRFLSIKK